MWCDHSDSVRSEFDTITSASIRDELDLARLGWERERAEMLARLQAVDHEFSELQVRDRAATPPRSLDFPRRNGTCSTVTFTP